MTGRTSRPAAAGARNGRRSRPAIPDRVRWAVDFIDPAPHARVLEIGCGPGAAAELICPRLTSGHLLAIDRSATAIQRTAERNDQHVDAGRLHVRQCVLDTLDDAESGFDIAFSINVNLFWVRNPTPELAILRRVIRPGGLLHVIYGTVQPTASDAAMAAIKQSVTANGFSDATVTYADAGTAVTARRT
ncbi:class I SAM-dependent methyltransferase [Actinopolymorpha alba]|uniref:class I SAM-dependent methyltransferase n=1 Tax=Actinopolymorpha alba TaxID=533267 RepID=UPI000364062C|nr:class I SAM-dependent methyltransferase [Actinopolymorpha alba]